MIGRRYRLEVEVGRGGMGTVHRAYDRLTGQMVALKQVTIDAHRLRFGTEAVLADFNLALTREFQYLAGLRHPHIVSVLDYGFDEQQQPYFTMEWLAEAQTIIQAGWQRPWQERLALLAQLLQALIYLHRRGIIHRDLKPANVLVTPGAGVKALDFGLSVSSGEWGQPGGTISYTAPELLQGGTPTPAADLYAVGVMAYELLAGRRPFIRHRSGTLVSQIVSRSPDLSLIQVGEPALDGRLRALVGRLLAKAPTDRYQDADAVIAAFNEAAGLAFPVETAASRESFLQAAPFVGREAETSALLQAWNAAQQGRGSAWLIGGESGVGKSRLADEVRIRALVAGALVLRAQAVSDSGSLYTLWQPVGRWLALLTELSDLEAAVLKAIVPDMAQLLGRPVPDAPPLELPAAQARLFTVVKEVVGRIAGSRPLLLIVEDLQWARAESMALLAWLSSLAAELPLLLLANYRDDEKPELPASLPQAQRLTLRRLSREDIAHLSAAMLGRAGRDRQLVRFLQRETEGNVFFLIEIVRELAETAGQLQQVDKVGLPAGIFPGGLQQVVQRRLARVQPVDQPLLEAAAVAGRALDLSVLAAVAPAMPWAEGQSGDGVEHWLTRCANATVLQVQDGRWQFAHDKLREGVLAAMPPDRRRQLHRQLAQALATAYPDRLAENAGAIAVHWEQAGELMPAAEWYSRAAEYAAAIYAMETATNYLQKTLEFLPDTPEYMALRLSYYISLGDISVWLARLPQALAAYKQAARLATALGDLEQQARMWLRLADMSRRQGDIKQQMVLARRAEQLARAAQAPAEQCTALLQIGLVSANLGQYAEAAQLGQQVLTLNNQLHDPGARARCFKSLARLYRSLGELTQAQVYEVEAQQLFAAQGNRLEEGVMWGERAHTAYLLGDYQAAETMSLTSQAVYDELGYREGYLYNQLLLGGIYFYVGDYSHAEQAFQSTMAAVGPQDYAGHEVLAVYSLGRVAAGRRQYARARDLFAQALELAQALGDEQAVVQALCYLGGMEAALGQPAAAMARLQQVLELVAEWRGQWQPLLIMTYLFLAQACQAQGDGAQALSWALKALALSRQAKAEPHVYQALAWRTLGNVLGDGQSQPLLPDIAELAGESLPASVCFRQALQIERQFGMKGEQMQTLADWSRQAAAAGKREQALSLWLAARALAAEGRID